MKRTQVIKFLDKRFKRVKGLTSSDWGTDLVWNVKSDGLCTGRFIFGTDSGDFILIDRVSNNEGDETKEIFSYSPGDGDIKSLIDYGWDFKGHVAYSISNVGGYLVELSDCGGSARVKDAYGSDHPLVSDWFEIETVERFPEELDEEGYPEWDSVIDPEGYNINLNNIMRI